MRNRYWITIGTIAATTAVACLAPSRSRAGAAWDEGIPLVGLDARGRSVAVEVSDVAYRNSLNEVASSVNDSLRPTLEKREHNARHGSQGWELHTVGVGISVRGLAGIEGVWSFSASKKIRLIFSDAANPVYPD